MRVWIDLANSPHPLLFEPVVHRLRDEGDEVGITFRDHAQTKELTLTRFEAAQEIGSESPRSRPAKARTIVARARRLTEWGRQFEPDVALSHNSYGQLIAARRLGVPSVTAMDYEHQPANHLGFRLATRILVPECFPSSELRRAGGRSRKVLRYPGFKEELYLAGFTPDAQVLHRLGAPEGRPVAVVRTAPSRAVYHRIENRLLEPVLRRLAESDWTSVVLVRHDEQVSDLEAAAIPGVIVPRSAVDSRSLLAVADLFIGAGGTMTREAALLGAPTFTIFAGRHAAVDAELERRGAIRRLHDPEQLGEIPPRRRHAADLGPLRERGEEICRRFVYATRSAAGADD